MEPNGTEKRTQNSEARIGTLNSRQVFKFLVVRELAKLGKWMVVGCVIVLAVWFISSATVKIFETSEEAVPWWLKTMCILLPSLFGAGLPTVFIARACWTLRVYIQTRHHQVLTAELAVDKNRQSSGLNLDGSSPNDL